MAATDVPTCPGCGSAPDPEPVVGREMMMGLRAEFDYRRCGTCSSLWLAEQPEDMSPYYGADYYSLQAPPVGRPAPWRTALVGALLSLPPAVLDAVAHRAPIKPMFVHWLAGYAGQGSAIADVGSGEGTLLSKMALWGFTDLCGIDPFIDGDRDLGPVRLRRAQLADVRETFDLVMFNHSLEHVPDPLRSLRDARDRLRPDGVVLVRLPVVAEAWRRYGTDWVGLDAPRHFFVPSVPGFEILADRAGLQIERTFFDSRGFQFLASERYARDIPLTVPPGELPAAELERERAAQRTWDRQARSLNRRRAGDTAAFLMRAR